MKKLSLYIALALTGLFMGSCGEEYEDWANPQTNAQENALTIPGFTATGVKAIDLGAADSDSVATYSLAAGELPDGYTLKATRIEMTPQGVENAATTTVSTSANGLTSTADLQALIESAYGKAPVARTFSGHVYADATKGGQACLIDAGTVTVTVTPDAPFVSAGYYVVGGALDWAASAKSKEQKFQHSETTNVYDDPVFTITIPAAATGDTWFAIGTEEACDAITNNNDWNQLYGTTKDNGKNGLNVTEKFDTRANLGGDHTFCVPASTGAKYIKITINIFENTYDIQPMAFGEWLYMAGNANDWKQKDYLHSTSTSFDGKYTGFMYLDQNGFKFSSQQDWDGTNYGEGFSTDGGAANITMTKPEGYYKVDVDLQAGKYTLTPITAIGIIGDAAPGGWSTDAEMTYNKSDRAWEINGITLKNGEMKFRANHAWDINWGGSADALVQNGGNLKVTAGTYNIKLYAWCDGKAKCEITKAASAKRHSVRR